MDFYLELISEVLYSEHDFNIFEYKLVTQVIFNYYVIQADSFLYKNEHYVNNKYGIVYQNFQYYF